MKTKAAVAYEAGKPLVVLITHKLPLARINEAFDLMHEGTSIRSVVEFDA